MLCYAMLRYTAMLYCHVMSLHLDMLSSADFHIPDVCAVYYAQLQANQEAYDSTPVIATSLTSSLCNKGVLTCCSSNRDASVQAECVTFVLHGCICEEQPTDCVAMQAGLLGS